MFGDAIQYHVRVGEENRDADSSRQHCARSERSGSYPAETTLFQNRWSKQCSASRQVPPRLACEQGQCVGTGHVDVADCLTCRSFCGQLFFGRRLSVRRDIQPRWEHLGAAELRVRGASIDFSRRSLREGIRCCHGGEIRRHLETGANCAH